MLPYTLFYCITCIKGDVAYFAYSLKRTSYIIGAILYCTYICNVCSTARLRYNNMFGQRLRYCYSALYCYSGSHVLANIAFGQHWKYCYSGEYCYNGDCYSGALLYLPFNSKAINSVPWGPSLTGWAENVHIQWYEWPFASNLHPLLLLLWSQNNYGVVVLMYNKWVVICFVCTGLSGIFNGN